MHKTMVLFVCLCGVVHAQDAQGGAATRGVFAPVLDSEKRPITAGGFVKDGPVVFKA
jgi:hypothetical protein